MSATVLSKVFASNKYNDTLEEILSYYYSKIRKDYVPAIISEGDLFEYGNDLYIKLIMVNQNFKVDKTWMFNNLENGLHENGLNIITTHNYKYKSLYALNDYLLNDSSITLVEQNSSNYFDYEYYGSGKKLKKEKVLLEDNDNLYLYYPTISDYLWNTYYEPKFDLYIEIEYRTFINNLELDKIGTFALPNGKVDIIYHENDNISSPVAKNKKMYWLRATIKLDKDKFIFNNDTFLSEYKVVELGKESVRNLNVNNYNDDMDAGLVVFSSSAYEVISKYYYFYDLKLIPKIKELDSCLVDYHHDLIVFWEGEFNSHLPYELKKELIPYNIGDRTTQIISSAMFKWQLEGLWDVFDEMLPNQQLARLIHNKYENKAIENGIDFFPPLDEKMYSNFVKLFFKITSLKIESLNLIHEKEKLLLDIISCNYKFNTPEDLYNNYMGLCYLFVKVLKDER